MKRLLLALAVLALPLALPACSKPAAPKQVRVLTDRTQSHLAPLFTAFEKDTGISVQAVYLDKGLVARLESRPEEADVVITKDADLLEMAKQKGLLRAHGSSAVQHAVPAQYRDDAGLYLTDSYRARVIYYSKTRVRPRRALHLRGPR